MPTSQIQLMDDADHQISIQNFIFFLDNLLLRMCVTIWKKISVNTTVSIRL